MKRILHIILVLSALVPRGFAGAEAGVELSFFLNERVAMVAEEFSVPAEALPGITLRAEMDGESLFLVFDCDARNLNLPEVNAPPYLLNLELGNRGGGKGKATLEVRGGISTEPMDLKVSSAVVDGFDESGWKQVAANQTMRQDGVWRVTFALPVALVTQSGMVENGIGMQARWRQLTGIDETGAATYLPSGGLVLALPGKSAGLHLRSATPGDVAPMLEMLAGAPDGRCADRCMRRLLWIAHRDESIRGALVMAMEHAEPGIRAAAARVWTEWSYEETPGLNELKAKAKAILAKPGQ